MVGPRATMLSVAIIATLAGGGGAVASWGDDAVAADGSTEMAVDTSTAPAMELPNGCAGDGWESEGSFD